MGPLDLNILLGSIVEKFSPQAALAQVKLSAQIKSLPPIQGDGDRLAQVFGNLVDNAIKYTQPGGQVTLRAEQQAGLVVIRVADNGAGIDPEDQKRIFERFFQVDKSRKGGAGRGLGLGLAIARQIVLAHHGDITVESALGKGSAFTVRLPLEYSTLPTLKA